MPMEKLLIFLFISSIAFGQANAENKAYVKDGKIIVETPQGVKQIDYKANSYKTICSSGDWKVEKTNINDALKVFNKNTAKPDKS